MCRRTGALVAWALLALACATHSGSGRDGRPKVVPIPLGQPPPPLVAYELPNATVAVSTEKLCRAPLDTAPSARDAQSMGWEFGPVELRALPFGPRSSEMPRSGPRRTAHDLFEAVRRETAHMNACYRWSRHRSKAGRVEVSASLSVDPWGVPSDVAVSGGGAELDECVKEGLGAMRVSYRTPRITKAQLKLAFEPSGLGRPLLAPARPKAHPRETPRSLCIQQPKPGQVDVLDLASAPNPPLATFDDWSQEQEDAEWQRQNPGKRRPVLRYSCTSVGVVVRPADVLRTIESNTGAFRQCYSQALGRTPGLRGKLVVRATLGDSGLVELARADGAGDKALADCMVAAFGELVMQPSPVGEHALSYVFELNPDPLPALREANLLALARTQLALLDADGALLSFAQAIRTSGGGVDECWGRLGVVQATLVKAPWVLDPRVSAATDQFVRWAASVPRPGAHDACLAAAASVIAGIGTWPFVPETPTGLRRARVGRWVSSAFGQGAQDEALARATKLLAVSPSMPGRAQLLDFAASVLAGRNDVDATIGALLPLFEERLAAEQAEPLLRAFARQASRMDDDPRPVLRARGCPTEGPL